MTDFRLIGDRVLNLEAIAMVQRTPNELILTFTDGGITALFGEEAEKVWYYFKHVRPFRDVPEVVKPDGENR